MSNVKKTSIEVLTAKFKSILSTMDSPLWNGHLPVPSVTAKKFIKANSKRILCSINNNEAYPCAIMPSGKDNYFILVNKALVKKLKIQFGEQVNVSIQSDTSEYGMPMPTELQELLNQDVIFENLFKALTPGKQRNLIYVISQIKSIDIRIEKSIIIAEHLKGNQGKLDFKMLYEAFKRK